MKIAKVIGNIWATRKEERLSGFKLLILQPINIIDGSVDEVPIVATDMIGAGIGETVIYVSGSSARSATGRSSAACRWCSRTRTAPCIRARPSTASWPNR